MGVPVVATRAGGCGETFVPGETGWLVTDAQPDVLAARVCEAWVTLRGELACGRLARSSVSGTA